MVNGENQVVVEIGNKTVVPFREEITTILEPNGTSMFAAEPIMTDTAKAEANLLNLLIVDDERAIRDGCREVAQAIGFSHPYCRQRRACLSRRWRQRGVDVVLLDLRLPGTGGLEVLREIKRRRPETVVIVITGYATVQSAVQAMKNGAYDYVTKPFNLEELAAAAGARGRTICS